MHNRENFTAYETMPESLAIYMSHNGPHFNKAAYEFAVAQMYRKEDEEIEPYDKQEIDKMIKHTGIKIKNNKLYDACYLASMAKADYLTTLPTNVDVVNFIKETLDDPDGIEGLTFNRWIADMKWLGIPIPWDELYD